MFKKIRSMFKKHSNQSQPIPDEWDSTERWDQSEWEENFIFGDTKAEDRIERIRRQRPSQPQRSQSMDDASESGTFRLRN